LTIPEAAYIQLRRVGNQLSLYYDARSTNHQDNTENNLEHYSKHGEAGSSCNPSIFGRVWTLTPLKFSFHFLGPFNHDHIQGLFATPWSTEIPHGPFHAWYFYKPYDSSFMTVSFVFIKNFAKKLFLTKKANVKN
jgi:hypothetical protein